MPKNGGKARKNAGDYAICVYVCLADKPHSQDFSPGKVKPSLESWLTKPSFTFSYCKLRNFGAFHG